MQTYFVYILANESGRIYIGVTNNLERRVWEHKQKIHDGFTQKYLLHKLVHFETTNNIQSAIQREKRLKWWPRKWKVKLIETHNPEWKDLAADWNEESLRDSGHPPQSRRSPE